MTETEIRLEYAKRQFEVYRVRASIRVAEGNTKAANNLVRLMEECNDAIDALLRESNPRETLQQCDARRMEYESHKKDGRK